HLAHDVHILKTALFEHIRDAGLTYKVLQKVAAERDNNWREDKDDRTIYQHYRRAPKGRCAAVQANFVWGEHYSLVAALTLNIYLAMNVVHGSVNSEDFFDFIVNDVLPVINPYPQDKSIIILDNCAIHKMNAVREVVESVGCVDLFAAILPRLESN
ncbi:hypothetical protein SERLA73DRAFT_43845, partial [Serpula lacrymans var. lacrymans S7.3]